MKKSYLAIDMGASSGRHVVGHFDGKRIELEELYRFENGTVTNISLSTFLLLMKAVGCINDLNDLMPEQPESLYLYNKKNKKVQRVRHKRQ